MRLLYVLILFFSVSGASASPKNNAYSINKASRIHLGVSKNKVTLLQDRVTITSKDAPVLITVDVKIPAHFNDSVTINALTCRDDKWEHLVLHKQFFVPLRNYSIGNNAIHRFKTIRELITPKVTNDAWQCELSTRWDGCKCNVVHMFRLKVTFEDRNETNDSTRERILSHTRNNQEPAQRKLLTFEPKDIKDMDRPSEIADTLFQLYNFVKYTKQYFQPAEKSISNKKSTETKSRDQKRKNQMPTEKIDDMDRVVKPIVRLKKNNCSSRVGSGEETISTTWVIFSVVTVAFVVGLIIAGVFCRHLWAQEPMRKQADDQTDEHIYDEILSMDISKRPPLPIPEKAEYIYNSPYDHTFRFQYQKH